MLKDIEIPGRILKLQKNEKGYPIPWFVEWIDGKPDFRVMDSKKWVQAVKFRLCWVCGEPLGTYLAFVIGPMCAVNRTSSEPPSHLECAEFSARACPFLSEPGRERRETNLPEDGHSVGGCAIRRNPGVTLIWVTHQYQVYPVKADPAHGIQGGYLIEIGDPVDVQWFAEGTRATPEQIRHSFDTGLPLLRKMAEEQGPDAVIALDKQINSALGLVP